jgi:hypothetical protein
MPLFGGPPSVTTLLAKNDVHGLIKALDYQRDPAVRIEPRRSRSAGFEMPGPSSR